jgi:hypothetical protein
MFLECQPTSLLSPRFTSTNVREIQDARVGIRVFPQNFGLILMRLSTPIARLLNSGVVTAIHDEGDGLTFCECLTRL